MDIIDSIGLEVETVSMPLDTVAHIANQHGWRVFDDRSCRSRAFVVGGIPCSGRTPYLSEKTMGGELISPIIDTRRGKWVTVLDSILNTLLELGEGVSKYTSIHVHINASDSYPIYALHNLVKIGLHIEDGMYRIACGESGIHRGELHLDHGYARPISEGGPPITPCTDSLYRPIFESKRLLGVENEADLQRALGRYDRIGGHYHEARYVWLNFLALLQKGSIEFRVFNFTSNVSYVTTWVELCKEIVRTSFYSKKDLGEFPLGSSSSFSDFLYPFNFDDPMVYRLERLWNLAKGSPNKVKNLQYGHLNTMVDWDGGRGCRAELVPSPITEDERMNAKPFDYYRDDDSTIIEGAFHIK